MKNKACFFDDDAAYIIGVDMPGHITVGDQLTIDIATDLRVPPAIVDVDDADHVPLQKHKKIKHQNKIKINNNKKKSDAH